MDSTGGRENERKRKCKAVKERIKRKKSSGKCFEITHITAGDMVGV